MESERLLIYKAFPRRSPRSSRVASHQKRGTFFFLFSRYRSGSGHVPERSCCRLIGSPLTAWPRLALICTKKIKKLIHPSDFILCFHCVFPRSWCFGDDRKKKQILHVAKDADNRHLDAETVTGHERVQPRAEHRKG